jgi:hypothetical protein
VFLYLDMLALVLYTAAFIVGQRKFLGPALAHTRFAGHRRRLFQLAVGLALAGGLADLGENLTVLNLIQRSGLCLLTGVDTAGWTAAKFVLFGINLALLLALWWFGRRSSERAVLDDAMQAPA